MDQSGSDASVKKAVPPRGKGYQESRRYDRDRRDNWRKNEKKTEKTSTEISETDSGSKMKEDASQVSRSSDVESTAAKDVETSLATERSSKMHTSSETAASPAKSSRQREDVDGGAQLLNLLQRATKTGSSATDRRDKTKVRSANPRGSRGSGERKTASDLEAQWQKEEEERMRKDEEKRKKEEEEQRKEEERIRREEQKKREAEELLEKERLKEQTQLEEYINEVTERIALKTQLKQQNKQAVENRGEEMNFSKLDSSLKKNTAFVKRLRNLTESQKDSLLKEFQGLNLSKYVGEVAAVLTEAKLKMSDINCALQICSAMHQRYPDFSPALLENWQKVLLTKKDDKVPNPSKLRVDLRLFAELVAVGVFTEKTGLSVLANQLTLLVTNDKEDHHNLSILLSFTRHCGDDYAGVLPTKYRLAAEKFGREIPRSQVLPAERQKACKSLLKDYFSSLCTHIVKDHKNIQSMERQNRKILQTKGELSEERQAKFEAATQAFQKLHASALTFAVKVEADGGGLDIFSISKSEYQYDGDNALFEDEDTRQFYENLKDLKAFIPGILYKDSEHGQSVEATQPDTMEEDNVEVEDVERELETETERTEEEEEAPSQDADADLNDLISTDAEVEEEGETGSSMKVMVENYLAALAKCVNRELIDKAAVDFCMNLNTKLNRKKLVRALFTVHRTRYDLLPFYSRLVATLCPCMPDIATELFTLLKSDFRWHVRKKDQINIESKLKNVRFIGELTKFNMFPKSDTLSCLKLLLADFSHHNIEMACSLLESCGRFLYRSPDSHHRTKVYLEVMLRKKTALHLDSRYTTLIENAFYYSNPPTDRAESRPTRPPLHQYIRKLLYKDLGKLTVEKTLRQMRKLDWDNEETWEYAAKCLVAVWNVRYSMIHCVANLLAGLAPYHESVAIHVVDGVLEDIRLGMEVNIPKMNQRRISSVKYLGELYNYRMVESNVIFKTLYSFITFGVTLDESNPSVLDLPEHLFRVRMVCTLLDTCGQYFDRGSSRKKLDCFLTYFQRYYWFKRSDAIWTDDRPFPVEVVYVVEDTIEQLRPKLVLCSSYTEACEEAELLDTEFRAKLASILPQTEEGDGLSTIHEYEDPEGEDGLSQHQLTVGSQESEDEREGRSSSPSHRHSQHTGEHEERRRQSDEEDEEAGVDVMESAGEEETDDQVTVLTGGPKLIKCSEDDDFMTAFDKMITDNIQARSQEVVKVPTVDILLPVQLRSSQAKNKTIPMLPGLLGNAAGGGEVEEVKAEEQRPADNTMQFTLMTKRGNKQQFCSLNIPMGAGFASKMKEREEAERMEKEKMKRMTLDIHERQEEEDYLEMLAALNRPVLTNVNREKRVKYQHPKGAPDADAIFGGNRKR